MEGGRKEERKEGEWKEKVGRRNGKNQREKKGKKCDKE